MEVIEMKAKQSPTSQMIALITMFTALAFIVTVLPAGAQEVVVVPDVDTYYNDTGQALTVTYVPETGNYYETWISADGPQDPPEIRIMKRIIQAALEEIEAPELPPELTESADTGYAFASGTGQSDRTLTRTFRVGVPLTLSYSTGSQQVTGFYMEGYGYLFTIRWPIRHSNLLSTFAIGGTGEMVIALEAQNRALEDLLIQREARRARAERQAEQAEEAEADVEAEQTAEERRQRAEALAAKLEEWQTDFEEVIIEELKQVMATYGHTLARAADDEKITFLFQPSEEEGQNITLSVERGDLSGPDNIDASMRAISVSRGSAESNPALKSQIRIMSEIIDAAFEEDTAGSQNYVISGSGYYFGGAARTQYVPGYGVIFTKSARMNLVTVLQEGVPAPPAAPDPDVPPPAASSRAAAGATAERQAREVYRGLMSLSGQEMTEASREKLLEHFRNLKQKTAEILATYGSTLTELEADEYVVINYEVGSSAGMLQGGVTNYMVLAKMSDVLQARRQSDGAEWLLERLITNEKSDNQ
jgi:hypothetical protein